MIIAIVGSRPRAVAIWWIWVILMRMIILIKMAEPAIRNSTSFWFGGQNDL
jgi:hypothetical protein